MIAIKEEYISSSILRSDFLPLSFLSMSPYTGSKNGLRFRIEKAEGEEGQNILCCRSWIGKLAYGHTDPSEMDKKDFPFSEEGLDAIVTYLNERLGDHR